MDPRLFFRVRLDPDPWKNLPDPQPCFITPREDSPHHSTIYYHYYELHKLGLTESHTSPEGIPGGP